MKPNVKREHAEDIVNALLAKSKTLCEENEDLAERLGNKDAASVWRSARITLMILQLDNMEGPKPRRRSRAKKK